MISVFGGTGFILGRFCEMFSGHVNIIDRESRVPKDSTVLYGISTTHNYNKLSADISTNIGVLSEVLENLNGDHKFIFLSSWFVCAKSDLPNNEQMDFDAPTGNYSFTKYLAEQLVRTYCSSNDIPYIILRIANVFGDGDNFSKQKNALQYLVNEMRNGRDIELYNDGLFYRDYIHVDSACRGMFLLGTLAPENEIYNLGSGRAILFSDLIYVAHRLLNSKSEITSCDPGEFHQKVQVKDFFFDINKTLNAVGHSWLDSPYEKFVEMVLDES